MPFQLSRKATPPRATGVPRDTSGDFSFWRSLAKRSSYRAWAFLTARASDFCSAMRSAKCVTTAATMSSNLAALPTTLRYSARSTTPAGSFDCPLVQALQRCLLLLFYSGGELGVLPNVAPQLIVVHLFDAALLLLLLLLLFPLPPLLGGKPVGSALRGPVPASPH